MIVLYNYSGFYGDYLFYNIWDCEEFEEFDEDDNYAVVNYNEMCVVRV